MDRIVFARALFTLSAALLVMGKLLANQETESVISCGSGYTMALRLRMDNREKFTKGLKLADVTKVFKQVIEEQKK